MMERPFLPLRHLLLFRSDSQPRIQELEFLVDASLLDPIDLQKIFAMLPDIGATPATASVNTTPSMMPVGIPKNAVEQAVKKAWGNPMAPTTHGYQSKPALPARVSEKVLEKAVSVYVPPAPASGYAPPAQTTGYAPPAPSIPPPPSYDTTQVLAKALYEYSGTDPNDLSFEANDKIIVTSHSDPNWWSGKLTEGGKEGFFPKNRVVLLNESDHKSKDINMMTNVAYGGPSNSGVGNSQDESADKGKNKFPGGDTGKKLGGKLGNAAIFGAGATIGSKIVNGIF
ncbi:hypothetical protein DFH27DRAFT_521148 [Peziza echinospora]|nr:hypothetical protein DFH27DRAFT_521148 [Peziza echinospora]